MRGSSEPTESWKTICMSRRIAFSSEPPRAQQVDAVELDLAGGRLEQPQERAAERRLAAARLADEADRLAAEDVEVDAVDRLELADGPLAGTPCAPGSTSSPRAPSARTSAGSPPAPTSSRVGSGRRHADRLRRVRRRRGGRARRASTPTPAAARAGAAGRTSRQLGRTRSRSAARSGSRAATRAGSGRRRGSPSAASSSASRAAGSSRAAPRCTGAAGSRRCPRPGRARRSRPAYMTATSSTISATTPRSWVISRIAIPSRSRSSFISSRICAWMVTSSAVVGSSAIRSFGLQRERHRDHHALAHAAGQLVRIVLDALRRRRGCRRAAASRPRASIASLRPTFWCSCTASAIWSPTVKTGFSDVIGSWKIIEISLPRIFSSSLSVERGEVAALEEDARALARSGPAGRPGASPRARSRTCRSPTRRRRRACRPARSRSRRRRPRAGSLRACRTPCGGSRPRAACVTARRLGRAFSQPTFAPCGTAAGAGTSMWRSSCASAIAGSRVCRAASSTRCSSTVCSRLRARS